MNNLIKKKKEIKESEKKENLINTKKKTFIVISSLDRDWFNLSETPFDFTVRFNDVENSNYTNISTNIKNVTNIKLEKLILSNKNVNINYTTNQITLDNYPFILVKVDKINNTIYGSNDNLNNCLGIMNSSVPILKNYSGHRFLEFKNINNCFKDFYNNPIANLSSLNFKIQNQLGKNLVDIQDVLNIHTIYNSGSGTSEILNIKTTNYFGSEYEVGDMIFIKNYVYRETDTISSATNFNNFINRLEGHKIIAVSSSSVSSLSHFNNIMSISIPHTISKTNGELTLESWYTDLKTKSSTDDSSSSEDNGGKLINLNLQTNLFVNIEYLEKDNLIKSELV